jgi:hypothetical protein
LGTRHRTKTNKTENREMYILFCPSVFFQNVLKVIVNAQIVKKTTHYTQIFDLVWTCNEYIVSSLFVKTGRRGRIRYLAGLPGVEVINVG